MKSKDCDAVIVLGGGVNPIGELSDSSKSQVKLATTIFNSTNASSMIATGAYSYKASVVPKKTEANAIKDYATKLGVPKNSIIIEDKSKDTIGNIYFIKTELLIPNDWHKLLIIATENHSKERLEYIFNKILGNEYSFKIDFASKNESDANKRRERKSLEIIQIWFNGISDGDHEAIYAVMKIKHPAYSLDSEYSVNDMKQMLSES